MIRLLADKHLYALQDHLPQGVSLSCYDPSVGIPDTTGFDALFVRTVSKVNSNTVSDPASLSFVATGSSGSDHLDKDFLSTNGIVFADAKGCNARAVAEYVITSILLWSQKHAVDPGQLSYGVVGAGAVGSTVMQLLGELGWKAVAYDPPRELRDQQFRSCTLNEALNCDVLTMHIPLEKAGPHPTCHWLDQQKISQGRFRLVINAARGGVTDEQALMNWHDANSDHSLITDVWEGEPSPDPTFLRRSFIATPHIAGYSAQSKREATRMIVDAFCDHFGLTHSTPKQDDIIRLNTSHFQDRRSAAGILATIHPVTDYDKQIRSVALSGFLADSFQELRTEGNYRNEYPFIEIPCELTNSFPILRTLGLRDYP